MYLEVMKNIGVIIVLFTALSSCSKSNLEEEMNAYCECMETVETTDGLNGCIEKLDSLTQHYEYDPEAIEYISSRIKTCPVSR